MLDGKLPDHPLEWAIPFNKGTLLWMTEVHVFAYIEQKCCPNTPRTDSSCRAGSEENNHVVWCLNLGFVCNAQECNLQRHACVITR